MGKQFLPQRITGEPRREWCANRALSTTVPTAHRIAPQRRRRTDRLARDVSWLPGLLVCVNAVLCAALTVLVVLS